MSRIAMASAALNKNTPFITKLDLNLRNKLTESFIWSIALYGAENWTLGKVDEKYLESCKMWCFRRMERFSWNNRKRKQVSPRVKEERNILHTMKTGKANWIGHILNRNCLLKHVIDGKLVGWLEAMGRRGIRRKQGDLKEEKRYWKLKEEALDRILWRIRLGRASVMNTALFALSGFH
jgi:hypothetical protein